MLNNKQAFKVGQKICSFTLIESPQISGDPDPRGFDTWLCQCDCGGSRNIMERSLINERPLFCQECHKQKLTCEKEAALREKPAEQLVLEATVARCIADYLKEYIETTPTTMHPAIMALIELSDYQEERIYKARRMAAGIHTELMQATFHEDMGR